MCYDVRNHERTHAVKEVALRVLWLTLLLAGCSLGPDPGAYVGPDEGGEGPSLLDTPDAGNEGDAGGGDDAGRPACPEGRIFCSDVCVDALGDALHCGSCSPCPVVRGARATCQDGACEYACAEGFSDMDDDLGPESVNGCECPGADGCPGDCQANECGGCGPLPAAVGSACGGCGTWTCDGPSLTCSDPGRNLCGGCEPLAATPGASCGNCAVWSCFGDQVQCEQQSHPELGCPLLHVTLDNAAAVQTPLRGAGDGEMSGNAQFVMGQYGNAFQASGSDWVRFPQAGFNGVNNIELSQGAISFLYKPGSVDGKHHLFRVSLNSRYELRLEYDGGMHGKIFDLQNRVAVSQSFLSGRFRDTRWVWLVFSWVLDPGNRPWGVWYIDGTREETIRWHAVIVPSAESPTQPMYLSAWDAFDGDGAQGAFDDLRIYPTSVH
mgnify:CR=1 FL=1